MPFVHSHYLLTSVTGQRMRSINGSDTVYEQRIGQRIGWNTGDGFPQRYPHEIALSVLSETVPTLVDEDRPYPALQCVDQPRLVDRGGSAALRL